MGNMTPDPEMRVWACISFKGHWPVGTAAVVVAKNKRQAQRVLEKKLTEVHLSQKVPLGDIFEVDLDSPHALILRDGNY